MILLAVWKLQEKAYGVTIRRYLKEKTGKSFSIGGVYVPLDRLVRKGYLHARQGEPTPERGGMRKRYFFLTDAGLAALREEKRIHDAMWRDVADLALLK